MLQQKTVPWWKWYLMVVFQQIQILREYLPVRVDWKFKINFWSSLKPCPWNQMEKVIERCIWGYIGQVQGPNLWAWRTLIWLALFCIMVQKLIQKFFSKISLNHGTFEGLVWLLAPNWHILLDARHDQGSKIPSLEGDYPQPCTLKKHLKI